MNYYPFHIGDYASATRHLSWDEDMAYRRLMDAYYTREEPIPLDDRQAFRLVMASTEEQRQAVKTVLEEFFVKTDEGWINERCEAEIHAAALKSQKASNSANARWRNAKAQRTDSDGNANASDNGCERTGSGCEGNAPNPKTKTNTKEEEEKAPGKPARFDPLDLELPEGLPAEKWYEWVAYRRKRKLSMTEITMRKQVEFLAGCIERGHCAADVIDATITNGWQGLFEPKGAPAQPRRSMNNIGVDDQIPEGFSDGIR